MQKPSLPRYILCRYVPMENGKSNKIPLNPNTLHADNPLEPSIHMTYEAAKVLADTLGESYGIGYVFMKDDNYFFIDLDGCINPDGTLTQLAQNSLTYFPSAYVETSHSGRGLHIIGRFHGEAPFDGKRLDSIGVEIYTSGRFCALAEIEPRGYAESFHTEMLTQYIKALGIDTAPDTKSSEGWTTESDPKYNVPEDNLKLIEWFMNKPLTEQEAFGRVLSIRHLWENNVDVLAQHFKTTIPGKPYDFSAADAALAYRLHYLTGGNCERVVELMNLSKLKREKWENSPTYLPRTVLNARGSKRDFFIYARSPQALEHNSKDDSPMQQKTGAFLNIEEQIAYFQNCTYIAETHQMLIPEGVLYKPEAFNAMYGGVSFKLDYNNEKVTRKAFEAFTLSQGYSFPKVHATCFKPLLGFGEIVTENDSLFVNIYRPVNPPRSKQDVQRFIIHVTNLLPNDEDRLILISYMAALIQYKGIKFTWCVIVQGVEGNGKSFLNEVLAYCIGRQYVHSPKSSDLTGKFNGWMENKLLITVDDIYQSSWDMLEILKPMITNRHQEIERKGIDKVTREVFCNFILNTNHQDGIRKTANDRRFAPLFTSQQERADIERDGMGGNYFPELFKWFNEEGGAAAINEYLSTFEIPDRYNPTGSCIRAPMTSSTELAITQSLHPIAQRILEWVEEGCRGFRNGWLSSVMINNKLKDVGVKINPKQLPVIVKSLGYVPHPALDGGRATRNTTIDQCKPRIYIHGDSSYILQKQPFLVINAYENDQK
jgi:hypothetical protein